MILVWLAVNHKSKNIVEITQKYGPDFRGLFVEPTEHFAPPAHQLSRCHFVTVPVSDAARDACVTVGVADQSVRSKFNSKQTKEHGWREGCIPATLVTSAFFFKKDHRLSTMRALACQTSVRVGECESV